VIQNHNDNASRADLAETDKPVLLFIDYEVPRYDMFAGSRTNFMYLEMLVGMGLKVIFLPADFQSVEPYTSELNGMGVETLDGGWHQKNWEAWLQENGPAIDYVFIHKPEPAIQFLPAVLRYTNASVIYQCHDLHYLRLQRKAKVENDPAILEEAGIYEQKEDFIFSNCDVLLTFSEVEELVLKDKFPDKKVFTIPLFFYPDMPEMERDFSRRHGLLFIGACAHTPNRDAISWFCREVFPLVQERIPGITIDVVGADPPEDIRSLNSEYIRILGRVSEDGLKSLYENVRMMVVPLRFGAGVKGKVIESLYNGVPLVSTSIGLEGIKGADQFATARDKPEDFAAEVVSLYTDDKNLQRLSVKGSRFVADNFTRQKTMQLMEGILSVSRDEAALRLSDSKTPDFETAGQLTGGSGSFSEQGGAVDSNDVSLGRLRRDLSSQKHRLEELEARLVRREQQVQDMLVSSSWKLTKPLRWVKQRLLSLKVKLKG
jgi:glycosyltransferase involved in cell wall biosynthesis